MIAMGRDSELLVVEGIKQDEENPNMIVGALSIGGRGTTVVLDFSRPNLAAFVEMPDELEHHPAAQNAIVSILRSKLQGANPNIPQDLSNIVRAESGPWPASVEGALWSEALVDAACQEPSLFEQTGTPGLIKVRLNVQDIATTVLVDKRGGANKPVRFQFTEGVHPWQLSPRNRLCLLARLTRSS